MKQYFPATRRKSRTVKIGDCIIGGDFPIAIQSMTNTDTRDVDSTVAQIERLTEAGCEIVRVAVPDEEAASKLSEIKSRISLPLVADIHFRYKLALEAIRRGVDKIRINPGNIGESWKVAEICKEAKGAGIPIRVGVNSGSMPKDISSKYGFDNPEAFREAALREIAILEDNDFHDIVVALKSSNVMTTLQAHFLLADEIGYPFHLGITESGTKTSGTIKSSVGLGTLLLHGIGDTIRVSLSADPVEEIRVARAILKASDRRKEGIELLSCPTCGRCEIDLIPLAETIERKTAHYKTTLKVAVMGCSVNGPGEARAADIGIAGGKGFGFLFRKGKIIEKIPQADFEKRLLEEIAALANRE